MTRPSNAIPEIPVFEVILVAGLANGLAMPSGGTAGSEPPEPYWTVPMRLLMEIVWPGPAVNVAARTGNNPRFAPTDAPGVPSPASKILLRASTVTIAADTELEVASSTAPKVTARLFITI